MNLHRLVLLLSSAAVVAVSAPAHAGQAPSLDVDAQQRFFAALHSVMLSDDQRSAIRGIIADGYLNGLSNREIDGQIADALDDAELAFLQDRLGYDPSYRVLPPDFRARFFAVVHSYSRNTLTLTTGRNVFVRNSRAFYPNRDALQTGVRIGIAGAPGRNGDIDAAAVVAFDEGAAVDFDPTSQTAGGLYATVVGASRSDLKLAGGKTVFLRDETVIEPSRRSLTSGSRIVIYGVPTADGNINADRVDVL